MREDDGDGVAMRLERRDYLISVSLSWDPNKAYVPRECTYGEDWSEGGPSSFVIWN